MSVVDILSWEDELVVCGRIVQDHDASVSVEEAVRRFDRYLALVDVLDGTEGEAAARALLRSIQAVHDYGAYQNTLAKLLFAFPSEQVAVAAVCELPRLIDTLPDWAADFLSALTQAQGRSEELVRAFRFALEAGEAGEAGARTQILRFMRKQAPQG